MLANHLVVQPRQTECQAFLVFDMTLPGFELTLRVDTQPQGLLLFQFSDKLQFRSENVAH